MAFRVWGVLDHDYGCFTQLLNIATPPLSAMARFNRYVDRLAAIIKTLFWFELDLVKEVSKLWNYIRQLDIEDWMKFHAWDSDSVHMYCSTVAYYGRMVIQR